MSLVGWKRPDPSALKQLEALLTKRSIAKSMGSACAAKDAENSNEKAVKPAKRALIMNGPLAVGARLLGARDLRQATLGNREFPRPGLGPLDCPHLA